MTNSQILSQHKFPSNRARLNLNKAVKYIRFNTEPKSFLNGSIINLDNINPETLLALLEAEKVLVPVKPKTSEPKVWVTLKGSEGPYIYDKAVPKSHVESVLLETGHTLVNTLPE